MTRFSNGGGDMRSEHQWCLFYAYYDCCVCDRLGQLIESGRGQVRSRNINQTARFSDIIKECNAVH